MSSGVFVCCEANHMNSSSIKIDSLVGITKEDMPIHFKCKINFDNINLHLKKTRGQDVDIRDLKIQNLIIFTTVGFFYDGKDIFEMDERKIYRTRRKIPAFNTELIRDVISNSHDAKTEAEH